MGHIGKGSQEPVIDQDESDKWFGSPGSSKQTVDQWSLLTLPLLNSANAFKQNIFCTFALFVTAILFYAI